MLIAKLVSTRSTCNSRPTGAVLVKDRQILATGYNGSMPGAPHCCDQLMPDGSPYCHRRAMHIADVDKYNFCRASHAEANAIAQAARHGVAIKGATLYVTLEPCYVCVKLLATAQIKRVLFELPYESRDEVRDAYWKQAVAEAGFEEYRQLTISPETLAYVWSSLTQVTSVRRLPATGPGDGAPHVGQAPSLVEAGQAPSVNATPPQARPAKGEYRRHLPHLQKEGKTLFVTFSTYKRWQLPEAVRALVIKHCLHYHGIKYWLHGAVVMPDHVHLILTPLGDGSGRPFSIAEIMNGIKGASAHSINKALGRRGQVWQHESFDHVLRSDESIHSKVEYICHNPVRHGLVKEMEEYPWLWREWVEGEKNGGQ